MRAVRSFKRQSRNTYLRKSKLNDLSSYCRDIIFKKKKKTARIGKKKKERKKISRSNIFTCALCLLQTRGNRE